MLTPRKFLAMSYDSYYDDVQAELHRMRRANKENGVIVWVVLPMTFVMHAVVLALVVWAMNWVFGNTTAVISVACAAYVSAVIGWAVYRVQQRSDQAALHATSVHDEILMVKELIRDEQRRSVQWKS